jgi:AcrR family transcriptional regulator
LKTPDKILAAARKEFADKGFEGARVDRIARAAGVNKAMIYYHFRSKENLYDTVIQEFLGRMKAFLQETLDQAAGPEELLLAIARFYVQVFESSPETPPILLREMATGGDRARTLFARMISEVEAPQKIRSRFEEGVRRGVMRRLDPPQAFVSFVGMNLFYLMFSPLINSIWEIDDDKAFRRARPEAVVDLFLNGVRAR